MVQILIISSWETLPHDVNSVMMKMAKWLKMKFLICRYFSVDGIFKIFNKVTAESTCSVTLKCWIQFQNYAQALLWLNMIIELSSSMSYINPHCNHGSLSIRDNHPTILAVTNHSQFVYYLILNFSLYSYCEVISLTTQQYEASALNTY